MVWKCRFNWIVNVIQISIYLGRYLLFPENLCVCGGGGDGLLRQGLCKHLFWLIPYASALLKTLDAKTHNEY